MTNVSRLIAIILSFVLGSVAASIALGSGDPGLNVPVCTHPFDQEDPQIVSDGASGAIVTWDDNRNDSYDIYAQHVLSTDRVDPEWPLQGRLVCGAPGQQVVPEIVSDGAHGAIIAWMDGRLPVTYRAYTQHLLANGTVDPAWPVDGRALCTDPHNQTQVRLVEDGAGGAIVVWEDNRAGNGDLYAQHVLVGGVVDPSWPPGGAPVCTVTGDQQNESIVADGSGGAIVSWEDSRTPRGIYAQHILATGTADPAWTFNGVAVESSGYGYSPVVVGDGAGGAIVAWHQLVSATYGYDILAQHLAPDGSIVAGWPAGGLDACPVPGIQAHPAIVSDGSDGAIIAWYDSRNSGLDIYAHHVMGSGVLDPSWPADGQAVCTAFSDQWFPMAVADGAGGAIVTWYDDRGPSEDVYAQHVHSNGEVDPSWPVDGRAVSTAPMSQKNPVIASDGDGGAVIAWNDDRNGNWDIAAQRVLSNGQLGDVLAVPGRGGTTAPIVVQPNPGSARFVTVRFTLDGGTPATLQLLDVSGRVVQARDLGSLGKGRHAVDLPVAGRLSPGVYQVVLRQGGLALTSPVVVLRR